MCLLRFTNHLNKHDHGRLERDKWIVYSTPNTCKFRSVYIILKMQYIIRQTHTNWIYKTHKLMECKQRINPLISADVINCKRAFRLVHFDTYLPFTRLHQWSLTMFTYQKYRTYIWIFTQWSIEQTNNCAPNVNHNRRGCKKSKPHEGVRPYVYVFV